MTRGSPDRNPVTNLSVIEHRLEQLAPSGPQPGLRHRILMAVDETLETVPATTSGQPSPGACPSSPDVVAGTFVFVPGWAWATAAVLGIALTLPVVAGVETLLRRTLPALAAELRAARVADESLSALVDRGPPADAAVGPVQPATDALPRRPASRAIELQRLIEETL